jgi:hypothetical protein
MIEAHWAMLRARVADVGPYFDERREFLLPSTHGAFLCSAITGDVPEYGRIPYAHVRTWLDRDQLRDDQRPIPVPAGEGERRMGDSYLLPAPLRRIFPEGDRASVAVLIPDLPVWKSALRAV